MKTDLYWKFRKTKASEAFQVARDFLLENRLDYDKAYRLFTWPKPKNFNWALEWFDVVAERKPLAIALELLNENEELEAQQITYSDLSKHSDAVACWLQQIGVTRGDRVMIVLGPRKELWELMLACMKVGAIVIPAYTTLTTPEANDRVIRGQVKAIFCDAKLIDLFKVHTDHLIKVAVSGEVEGWLNYAHSKDELYLNQGFFPEGPTPANSIAFAYFTSGTTRLPKLVAHTHVSYPIGHLSSMYWNGLLPDDRHLNISSPGWAKHSWSSLFVPWNAEATIVALPEGFTDYGRLPLLLNQAKINSICAPPSTWISLKPHLSEARPVFLREATSAGEPLDSSLMDAIQKTWGVTVRDGYGQTETTGLIGTTPGMKPRPGWLGKPLPGYQIVLGKSDEISIDLSTEPIGMMAGTLKDGTLIPRSLNFYSTGDIGEQNEEGWIRILGRTDDVFKSFDHRISPYELEAILNTHPAVAEVAIVPRSHPMGGFVPHGIVVLRSKQAETPEWVSELLLHAGQFLPPALRPWSVEIRQEDLPRTRSGKIRRGGLVDHSVKSQLTQTQ